MKLLITLISTFTILNSFYLQSESKEQTVVTISSIHSNCSYSKSEKFEFKEKGDSLFCYFTLHLSNSLPVDTSVKNNPVKFFINDSSKQIVFNFINSLEKYGNDTITRCSDQSIFNVKTKSKEFKATDRSCNLNGYYNFKSAVGLNW